jgi:excisionase family DNA binding protein
VSERRLLPEEPVYVSVADVAALFGTSPQTIRNWIGYGDIPVVRLGPTGAYRIPASWVVDITRRVRGRQGLTP